MAGNINEEIGTSSKAFTPNFLDFSQTEGSIIENQQEVVSAQLAGVAGNTQIYQVPDKKRFYIVSAILTSINNGAGNAEFAYICINSDEISNSIITNTLLPVGSSSNSINFSVPILIKSGETIDFKRTTNGGATQVYANACIVGYLVDS